MSVPGIPRKIHGGLPIVDAKPLPHRAAEAQPLAYRSDVEVLEWLLETSKRRMPGVGLRYYTGYDATQVSYSDESPPLKKGDEGGFSALNPSQPPFFKGRGHEELAKALRDRAVAQVQIANALVAQSALEGDAKKVQASYISAAEDYQRAFAAGSGVQDASAGAECFYAAARLAREAGNSSLARQLFHRGIKLIQKLNDCEGKQHLSRSGAALRLLAEGLSEVGEYRAAVQVYDQAYSVGYFPLKLSQEVAFAMNQEFRRKVFSQASYNMRQDEARRQLEEHDPDFFTERAQLAGVHRGLELLERVNALRIPERPDAEDPAYRTQMRDQILAKLKEGAALGVYETLETKLDKLEELEGVLIAIEVAREDLLKEFPEYVQLHVRETGDWSVVRLDYGYDPKLPEDWNLEKLNDTPFLQSYRKLAAEHPEQARALEQLLEIFRNPNAISADLSQLAQVESYIDVLESQTLGVSQDHVFGKKVYTLHSSWVAVAQGRGAPPQGPQDVVGILKDLLHTQLEQWNQVYLTTAEHSESTAAANGLLEMFTAGKKALDHGDVLKALALYRKATDSQLYREAAKNYEGLTDRIYYQELSLEVAIIAGAGLITLGVGSYVAAGTFAAVGAGTATFWQGAGMLALDGAVFLAADKGLRAGFHYSIGYGHNPFQDANGRTLDAGDYAFEWAKAAGMFGFLKASGPLFRWAILRKSLRINPAARALLPEAERIGDKTAAKWLKGQIYNGQVLRLMKKLSTRRWLLYQAGAIRFEMFALHAWNNVATSLDVAYRNARFDEDRSWWEAIKQANSKDALLHTAALLFGLKVAGLGLHPLHQAAISQRAQRNSLEINIRQFQKLSAEIQAKLEAAEGVPACGAVREQTRRLIELGDRIHGIGERSSRVGFEQQSRWLAMRQWLARGVEPALSPAHETLAARIRHEDPVGYLNEISETLYLRGQRYQDIDIHRVMDGLAADLQTLRNPQAAAPEHAAAVNRLVSLVEHYRSLGRDAIGDHFTLGLIDGLYAPAAEQPVPFAVAARSAGGARFSPTAETSVPIFLYPDSAPETSPGVRPIPFVEQIFGRGLDPRRFAILGRRGAGHDFEDVYVFPVESPAVSQEHAMIFINPKGQRVLKDLSSGNPKVPGFRTWVREEAIPGFPLWRPLRLREEVVLRPETEFALGRETPEHPETVRYRLSPDGEGLMAVEN